MSWLARSLANSLRLDDGEEEQESNVDEYDEEEENDVVRGHQQNDDSETKEREEDEAQVRGALEDLDEFKHALTRQLRGITSFLAPPPANSQPSDLADQSEPSDQFDPKDGAEEEEAVGITEEVLTFARNIAMHPETWLDFPIDHEDDTDDFDMSVAQLEHAVTIERLAPRLAALRIELCPCHLSEGYFWKVYFVLLHSRLNKQDAVVLSTPQVMTARAMWMQELQKLTKPESEWHGRSTSNVRDIAQDEDFPASISDYAMSHGTYENEPTTWPAVVGYESEKHTTESSEVVFVDKSVIEEKLVNTDDKVFTSDRSSRTAVPNYEDDEDEWLEEDSELQGTTIPMVNEEDISFSDLEDDDYGLKPIESKIDSKAV